MTAPGVAPLIEVRDVVKRFSDKTVLNGVNLTVQRGETLVLIGGSGSGKSTLARILIGLDEQTSGEILVDGVPVSKMDHEAVRRVRARFAMVFQKPALLDSLPVFDNVAFPLREHTHMNEEAVKDAVMRALGELGVEDAVHKLPGELSGGMAKRSPSRARRWASPRSSSTTSRRRASIPSARASSTRSSSACARRIS